MIIARRHFLLAGVLAVSLAAGRAPAQQRLPDRLTDKEFWQLVTDLSEPGGYWDSENLLSNEASYQVVIPAVLRVARLGGVYLGVGPEQNFTYIAALQPKMAFVFDIRRSNMLHILLYKALFELSADRGEFVSRLFSRARPAGLDTSTAVDSLFRAFLRAPADSALYRTNLAAVKRHLLTRRGLPLSADDQRGIETIYVAFFEAGPTLDYNFRSTRSFGLRPTYAELMTATDEAGRQRGYLAAEAYFRIVKALYENNLLVPVVGNFAGPQAVRGVGKYLREHRATVSAFYTSNVEQYLFRRSEDWKTFYDNVGALPMDSSSVFIRAVFPSGYRLPGVVGGSRSSTLWSAMLEIVNGVAEGRVSTYADVVTRSR